MKRIVEGKPWPGPHSAVVRWGQEVFAGSTSKNYHRADWFQTDIDPKIAKSWPTFNGDPNVPEPLGVPILRMARWAGLVATRTAILDDIRREYPTAVDGVVTRSLGGNVWACILPKDIKFAKSSMDGQPCEIVGARIGQHKLYVMSSLIVPETSDIIIPAIDPGDVRPLGPHEFVPRLPELFAKVPVV